MAKTLIYNVGNRFGDHGDPAVEATPKHPLYALGRRVTYLGGDIYSAKYGSTPLTKAQLLEDQFAVEGTWRNPPAEVIEALYAERVTIGASYEGMSGSLEIRRGYSRGIDNGTPSTPTIDPEATRFFAPDAANFDDYLAASEDISIWTSHHFESVGDALDTGGIYSERQDSFFTAFVQVSSEEGTTVEEYLVDTGIELGEGTYSLRFEGTIGSTSATVRVEFRDKALYLSKHSVWILPFYVTAFRSVTSSLNVIQDALYFSMLAGEDGAAVAEAEANEYASFAADNPNESYESQPNGSGILLSGSVYFNTPQTLVDYDDPPPAVTLEDFVKMPVFLPEEEGS